jgi:signal transduction histidine kinase/DNA-binding response OmpR family regulator
MKQIFLLITLLLLGVMEGMTQDLAIKFRGLNYFKYYSNRVYNRSPQNWVIRQDQPGVIYVANQGGVLQFDGKSWESIDVPNKSARSLAIGNDGIVYIGGENEIGRLKPDKKGKLHYESLLNFIDENQRNFGRVWRANTVKEKIFFRAGKYLFQWNSESQRMKTWSAKNVFNASFSCRTSYYTQDRKVGLMQIVNDSLTLVPGGEAFAGRRIFMIAPYGKDQCLVGTQDHGLFIYNGKTPIRFNTEADEYLKTNVLYHGIRLSSGEFALATLQGGVVIIDERGHLKKIYSKASGLPDDNVKWIFEDRTGNLWFALNNGLAKIEYHSPFSIYNEQTGLPGLVLSVTRYRDTLHCGTSAGLFFLSPTANFSQIPGIQGNCFYLLATEHGILAGTTNGVYWIQKNHRLIKKICGISSYYLLRSVVNPRRIWVATEFGLASLYLKIGNRDPQWKEEYIFKNIKQELQTMVEDSEGNLWLGPRVEGVLYVNFSAGQNFEQPPLTRYDSTHGLPDDAINVYLGADHVIFATEKGIFRFDEKRQYFYPDYTLGKKFAGGKDSPNVFLVKEDRTGTFWFHSRLRNFQAIPKGNGSYKINATPFLRVPPTQVNDLFIEGGIAWFASNDGLIRYDAAVKKNYHQEYPVLIRKVIVNGETLFFDSYKNLLHPGKFPIPVLAFKNRNLRFEFAAPFFENEAATLYRSILERYDSQWSSWSPETWKNYTNLDSGKYRFRVQAKNVYEHVSREAFFSFKILPPWYKTWWAFLFYAAVFVLLLFYVAKWRSLKLEKEKQRLEQIVEERTKEVNQKNQQLEKQTGQLKEQSVALQEMDRVKSRFFANISHEFRTPLTLIMGPMEQMLIDSSDQKQKEQLDLMLSNSQRLLTLISQLLDLSRFDSREMKLKAAQENVIPVLKGIVASFQPLIEKKQIEFKLNCRDETVYLYFNREQLEEIMSNLLINAAKFTPYGGKIVVSITKILPEENETQFPGGFLQISVRDSGIGIPKDQLAHIFDRFYQAEIQQTQKGFGIGLALTKELICLHHGDIDVTSQEGQGTEFLIRLPLGAEHLSPQDMIDPSESKTSPPLPGDVAARYLSREIQGAEEPIEEKTEKATGTGTQKTVILVVEDNVEMRKYIRGPLETEYHVIEAANGQIGIDLAKDVVPDLVISDIMMPTADGYQLCHALKNDINTSHIPIILLTAKASEQSIIRGLETGADDYITKPFNTKILLTRIKNLIELRRQLQLKIQRQKMLLPAEIPISSMDETFLKEFQEIVEKKLSDPDFTVDLLCKKLCIGRTNLFKKVEALTGETPKQFIQSYRLERAYQLLKANFGNVTEVAFEVGFSSTAYFTKCFKEKYQCLPSTVLASEA